MPTFKPIREYLGQHGWPLLAGLAVLGFFLPLLLKWGWYGKGDWGYFHFLDAVARRTILDFGELPEWNPYACGGNVLAANTQAHVSSPWLVFPLIFGPAPGAKLAVLLHAGIGAVGMFALLGAMGIRGAGRFLGTVLFACSGFFGHQVGGGHVWSWPFYYLPLVVLFLLRGCYDTKWATLAGLFWGLMAMEGGVYPAPYTGVLVGTVALGMLLGWRPLDGRERARGWRVLAAFGACAAIFALVGAMKLLPDLYHMAAYPRQVSDYDRIGFGTLLDGFTMRRFDWGWDRPSHHNYGYWGEYANYVGWAGLALAAGAVALRFRKARAPLVFLALSLSLAMGSLGTVSPWSLLHRLPVFENLRVPSRFTVFASLVLAYLAALAVSEGQSWLRSRLTGLRGRRVALLLPPLVAIAVAADVATANAVQFWDEFVDPPPAADQPPAAMKQVRGTYKRMYDHVARNHGTLVCQEINSIPRSPRVREQTHEYAPEDPADGTVRLVDWSPNEIHLDVDLRRAAVVWVNQNYHRGWSSDLGTVQPLENQLTVKLPAGKHRVRLVYRAPGLRAGLALTSTGLLLVAGWFAGSWWWRRRKKPADPTTTTTTTTTTGRESGKGWWWRVFAPNAALAAVSLAVLFGPVLLSEPGDLEWAREVHDTIRPRFREGDVIQLNLGWVGATNRLLQGLDQIPLTTSAELVEGGWRRLWYVFCRRDGDERRLKEVQARFPELARTAIGHYTILLLEPENSEQTVYLADRLGTARAEIVPPGGETGPQPCRIRGSGQPLVCGAQRYQEIRVSHEKIGGQIRRCVWMHPLPGGAELALTFPGLLAGVEPQFVFRYGLTDAAVTAKSGGPVEVTVLAGGVRLRRVVAKNEAGWFNVALEVPPDAPRDLVVTVAAPDAGARHFCVGADFERAPQPVP